VSVQDRCMVYVKCTMGSEIIFDIPSATFGDEDQAEARFSQFGDRVNLDAR
jgi:hypothetical protein